MSSFAPIVEISAYQPAIVALAVLCVMVLVQALLTAPLGFLKEEQAPGMPLRGDHELLSFRVLRTYANSAENLPVFGFTLGVAMIAGVSPLVVNWLAGLHVVARLLFWVIYYSGVGKVAGGPRSMAYVGGSACNLALAGMALHALIV